MSSLSPPQASERVRRSNAWVVAQSDSVEIDFSKLTELGRALAQEHTSPSSKLSPIPWEECPGHLVEEVPSERTAWFCLVIDTINFCFWPLPGFEYEDLARMVSRGIKGGWTPERMMDMKLSDLEGWLEGSKWKSEDIPQGEERCRLLRETASTLVEMFDGKVENLLRGAEGSAVRLAELVVRHFPGFRDECIYKGRQVFFYKRAQIFVADLWGALGLRVQANGRWKELCGFKDIDKLTMFADYRVPQVLRHRGILKYTLPDSGLVSPGTPLEVEIRAGTIEACRLLVEFLQKEGVEVCEVTLDWLLWQIGEASLKEMESHHKTLTVFY